MAKNGPWPWQERERMYQRCLIPLTHGFPSGKVAPNYDYFPTFSQRGYSIGDVIMSRKTSPGAMRHLFNVFESKDHPVQAPWVPVHYSTFETLERPEIREEKNFFPPGTWIATGGVTAVTPSSKEIEHEFICPPGAEGAVIGFPFGADRQDLVEVDFLREYIKRHAVKWYDMVMGHDDYLELLNGSLFLVTGVDNTDRFYGTPMTHDDPSSTDPKHLKVVPDLELGNGYYDCEGFDNCGVFTFKPNDIFPSWKMAVFLRGFSIMINPTDFVGMIKRFKLNPESYSISPRKPFKSKIRGPKDFPADEVWYPPLTVYQPALPLGVSANLSRIMLHRLLYFMPKSSVATIHCNEWMTLVRAMKPEQVQELVSGDLNVFADKMLEYYRVVVEDGLVQLKLREVSPLQDNKPADSTTRNKAISIPQSTGSRAFSVFQNFIKRT